MGGLNVTALALACVIIFAAATSANAADHRLLWLHGTHLDEEVRLAPFGTHGVPRWIAWGRLDRLFRSHRTRESRAINPRLLRVLAQIQRHFDGRRIELLSGYRTPEDRDRLSSYHQVGRAADIYIPGVPNRDLYDYCRELVDVGCGLYPHGSHVHVDARSRSGTWVDLSEYGEAADYVHDVPRWLLDHPEAGRTTERKVRPRLRVQQIAAPHSMRSFRGHLPGIRRHVLLDFVVTDAEYPACVGTGWHSERLGPEAAQRLADDIALAGSHDRRSIRRISRDVRP